MTYEKEKEIEQLLTSTQVAHYLNCSRSYVYKMAKNKTLPCILLPSNKSKGKRSRESVRFKMSQITNYLAKANMEG
jgi:excisionase family DNA binding protein